MVFCPGYPAEGRPSETASHISFRYPAEGRPSDFGRLSPAKTASHISFRRSTSTRHSPRFGQRIASLLGVLFLMIAGPAIGQITLSPMPVGMRENAPYAYYRLTLNNATGEPLGYSLTIQSDYSEKQTIRIDKQMIPAGAERIYNLALPLSRNVVFKVVDSNGQRNSASQTRGERYFLQIDDVANWASEKEMLDFSAAYMAPPASTGPQPQMLPGQQQVMPEQMKQMQQMMHRGMTPEQIQQMMMMGGGSLPPGATSLGMAMPSTVPLTGAAAPASTTPLTELTSGGMNPALIPPPITASTPPGMPFGAPPGAVGYPSGGPGGYRGGYRGGYPGSGFPGGFPGGFRRGFGMPGTPSNLVSQLEPVSLPDNWLCYAPFKAIFVWEPAFDRMGPTEKDALMKWVRSGGDLTVYGSDKNTSASAMLGMIRFQPMNPVKTIDIQQQWRGGGLPWERYYMSEDFGDTNNTFIYDSKERGGRLGGLALASAFFILAGPINYIYFKRKKQIRRLLIALPLISVGFCLLIIVYFVAVQGFAKKGGSFGITMLDEASDAAFTFTRHSFYSGLYPMGGFSFDKETAFYPLQRYMGPNALSYSFNLTRMQDLESGLFSPSFNFHYFTAMPSKTRERLVYDRNGRSITNGFEKPLQGVLLYDGSRILYANEVAPGAKETLREIQNVQEQESYLRSLLSDEEKEFLGRMDSFYQPALQAEGVRYFARLKGESAPLQDGVTMRSAKVCNLLVGKLQENPERGQ